MFSIPLSNYIRKINNTEYRNDFELKIIPELSFVKKTGNLNVLYSPLNVKIYVLDGDEYNGLFKKKLDGNDKRLFFENDLIIMKNIDPYPKSDINQVAPLIFLTTRCNLKCLYCFSKGGDVSVDNSFERIKLFLNLWQNSSKKFKDTITFFSTGEPTLAFDLLKKTVNYIKKNFKRDIKFSMTSNGVFPRSVAEYIIKNNISVQISCDGPPYIQDAQRPMRSGSKSSKIIEENIKYFVKNGFKNFHTHSVITKYSEDKMEDILNYFHRLGVNRISYIDMFVYGGREREDLLVKRKDYIENTLKVKELSEAYDVRYGTVMLPSRYTDRFCGSGRSYSLLENGTVTTCNNAQANDRCYEFFTIGRFDEKTKKFEFDEKKRMHIASRTAYNISECKNCVLRFNCAGGCPYIAFLRDNNIFSVGHECKDKKKAFESFVDYKIQKELIKIKPALEISGGNLYYSMVFNKFKLRKTNWKNVKFNSLIKINGNENLKILTKKIIKARDSNGYKTSVFLLSFDLSEKYLNRNFGNKVVDFLVKLKENRIFFVVTKPLCRQLFMENYDRVRNEFRIPKNWYESLELFKLRGKRAVLRNGEVVKIRKNTKRSDIYREFKNSKKEIEPTFKKCKSCVYGLRKNCGYRFFE